MRAVAAHARKWSPCSLDYWCFKVDPAGELDLSDREIRARSEMRLYFANLGKRTRRQKAQGGLAGTKGHSAADESHPVTESQNPNGAGP
jgi:hypothetical protein